MSPTRAHGVFFVALLTNAEHKGMKTYSLYQLTVEGDLRGIYYGVTSIQPSVRKGTHLHDARLNKPNRRSQWLRAALAAGRSVHLRVLQENLDADTAYAKERELIRQARASAELECHNTDDGGAPNWSQAHTPESREKARLAIQRANSREWEVTSPLGVTFTVTNMKQFCRENQLDPGTMSQVARGNQANHKGWTCRKLSDGATIGLQQGCNSAA